jgi:HSP20 family protein
MAKQSRKEPRTSGPKQAETPAKSARTPALALGDRGPGAAAQASPFAVMRRFAEEMDRLFDDFRRGTGSLLPRLALPGEGREAGEAGWLPPVEVTERGGQLVIRADLPGLGKDDVKVEVRDDAIAIQGERRQEKEEKRRGFYRSERSYGSFYREIPLPEGTAAEQAKASFRNGVLEVTMPAPPKAAKGRRLSIEEG